MSIRMIHIDQQLYAHTDWQSVWVIRIADPYEPYGFTFFCFIYYIIIVNLIIINFVLV